MFFPTENEVMALILWGCGINMIIIGITLSKRLFAQGLHWPLSTAISSVLVLNGIYLLWVGRLFWQDALPPGANYSLTLYVVRIGLLITTFFALYVVFRYRLKIRVRTGDTGEHEL